MNKWRRLGMALVCLFVLALMCLPMMAQPGVMRTNVVLVWEGVSPFTFGGTNVYQSTTISNTPVMITNVTSPSTFRIYSKPDVTVDQVVLNGDYTPPSPEGWAVAWQALATAIERRTNNYGVMEWVCRSIPVTPANQGKMFYVITESNYWGESSFSPVAWTPYLPQATNRNVHAN